MALQSNHSVSVFNKGYAGSTGITMDTLLHHSHPFFLTELRSEFIQELWIGLPHTKISRLLILSALIANTLQCTLPSDLEANLRNRSYWRDCPPLSRSSNITRIHGHPWPTLNRVQIQFWAGVGVGQVKRPVPPRFDLPELA